MVGHVCLNISQLQQQQLQNNSQLQQNYSQLPLSSQQSQNSILQQHDKMIGASNMSVDGSMSNTFQGNDQA